MSAAHKGEGLLAAEWTGTVKSAAQAQLTRILESPQFRSSRRCSRFLRFVVDHAAEGRFESLKERTVGVEVFDRDPDYDTNQDPVVRSTAGEVRKRLAQYYTESGREDAVRITLPIGSYIPEVNIRPVAVEPVPAPAPAPVVIPIRRSRKPWWAAIGALAVAAISTAALLPRPTDLDRFWAPALAQKQPLLVCLGQPNAADALVGLADAQAFSRFAAFFGRREKALDLRGAHTLGLADLRGRPALLIGAFDSDWPINLAASLRFDLGRDPLTGRAFLRDRHNPGSSEWRRPGADYALVTRVADPDTHQVIVMAAGIADAGTQVASEFLSNPEYFAEALRGAPGDWQKKNIQVVLSAKVMSGPRVLAVHFW